MNLPEILNRLQDPSTSPGEMSEYLLYFSAEYSRKASQLQETLTLKARSWGALREKCSSDKQADKAWDKTPEGIMEMGLKLELKSLEKLMSAIKSHLRIKETEARNLI